MSIFAKRRWLTPNTPQQRPLVRNETAVAMAIIGYHYQNDLNFSGCSYFFLLPIIDSMEKREVPNKYKVQTLALIIFFHCSANFCKCELHNAVLLSVCFVFSTNVHEELCQTVRTKQAQQQRLLLGSFQAVSCFSKRARVVTERSLPEHRAKSRCDWPWCGCPLMPLRGLSRMGCAVGCSSNDCTFQSCLL